MSSGTAASAIAPPSRWLALATLAIVVTFTLLRFVMAAGLDLRSDEAYYWTWSLQAVPSYLDHPPMVAWFERIGQMLFGDTALGARFAQILALPVIEILLADIARRRTGSWNAALFVILALECTVYFAMIVVIIEPSIPLLLFTSIALWAMCRLDESMDPRYWLLIGLAAGMALLSKYTVLLAAPALLVFLLIAPRHRRWLTTSWPWIAMVIAIALFSPVLIWNAKHGWPSFTFQGARLGEGHAIGIGDFLRFVIYDTLGVGLVLTPAAIAGSVALAFRAARARQPFDAALATAFLFPVIFFAIRSLTLQINQSWAYFVWPLGILALALALPWSAARRRVSVLIGAVAVTGLPLVAALFFHAVIGKDVWFGRGDPLGQDAGFGEMAQAVLADAKHTGATWIATTEYRTYANLLWHIGDEIPVVQVDQRARFLDFAPLEPSLFQGTALYVHFSPPSFAFAGATRNLLRTLPVVWRDVAMNEVTIETLEGFAPELNPAPGSAAYRWTQ